MSKYALERTCYRNFEKANRKYAQNQPEEFMEILKTYMGTGMHLHNEIVLDATEILTKPVLGLYCGLLCTGLNEQ